MLKYKDQVTAILTEIMQENSQDSISDVDRVSLIKFSYRLRRIFSLVQKDSNFAQLKNQVDKLEFNEDYEAEMDKSGYLPKALAQLVYEFESHKQIIKKQDNSD